MDAMSVASNCSIIYYTPQGGGDFFFLNWRGVLWKSGGVNPPLGGSRNIPARDLDMLQKARKYSRRFFQDGYPGVVSGMEISNFSSIYGDTLKMIEVRGKVAVNH